MTSLFRFKPKTEVISSPLSKETIDRLALLFFRSLSKWSRDKRSQKKSNSWTKDGRTGKLAITRTLWIWITLQGEVLMIYRSIMSSPGRSSTSQTLSTLNSSKNNRTSGICLFQLENSIDPSGKTSKRTMNVLRKITSLGLSPSCMGASTPTQPSSATFSSGSTPSPLSTSNFKASNSTFQIDSSTALSTASNR